MENIKKKVDKFKKEAEEARQAAEDAEADKKAALELVEEVSIIISHVMYTIYTLM